MTDQSAVLRCPTTAALSARIEATLGTFTFLAICGTVAFAIPLSVKWIPTVVAVAALVLGLVEVLYIARRSAARFRVEIRDEGVVVHRGVVLHSVEFIPSAKITVVQSHTGPLLRKFGLVKCIIFTPAREVILLPLSSDDADQVLDLSRRAC